MVRPYRRYNAKPVEPKIQIGVCGRCNEKFEYMMVKKRHTLCATCKPIAAKESRRESYARHRDKVARGEATARKPRLVRYAGYDGGAD